MQNTDFQPPRAAFLAWRFICEHSEIQRPHLLNENDAVAQKITG